MLPAPHPAPASLAYRVALPGTRTPTGIDYGGMAFLREKCPNGVEPTVLPDPGGDILRLCVQKDAYSATDGEPLLRDRCELRDGQILLGTPVQYMFDLRIEPGFPIVDARMVVAQVKAPYYDANGGSPLFALRFERGGFVATVEHLYEVKDADFVDGSERSHYLSPFEGACAAGAVRAFDHHLFGNGVGDFQELQVRALLATDGRPLPTFLDQDYRSCTTGIRLEAGVPLPASPFAWHRFRLCIAPTREKDFAGLVALYVADQDGVEKLVARATGEFGHRGYRDPAHNTGPIPDQAYQYFKIGPYRDKTHLWGDAPAAIQVRNIARAAWPEASGFYQKRLVV